MGYSFRLAARFLLYAPSHRQDNTYHDLCYTSHGALAETRNSSMGPPWRIDPTMQKEGRKCFLFNDALNTFYFTVIWRQTYGKGPFRWNPLPPHGLLYPISSKGSFICIIPDRIAHTTAFVTPVMEQLAGTRNSSMGSTPWRIDPTTHRK